MVTPNFIQISDTEGGCSPGHNVPTCCSTLGPCQVGEGGCSADSDCQGDLVCGKDNCQLFNASSDASMDCCIGKVWIKLLWESKTFRNNMCSIPI